MITGVGGSRSAGSCTTASPGARRTTTRFVYHGWNLLTEYSVSGSTLTLQRKNTWGLDRGSVGVLAGNDHGGSGALDSAGGIGGLLATLDTQGTTTTTDDKKYVYFYDANGNVGQAVDTATTTSVTIAARYEYDAYGVNVLDTANLAQSGPTRKRPCCCKWVTKWPCPALWSMGIPRRYCCDERSPEITFLALYDPVDMRPGGVSPKVPGNVANCAIAIGSGSAWEFKMFPLQDFVPNSRVRQGYFVATHGEVGMGRDADAWMRRCACDAGVQFVGAP